jgi:5-hydroxyisourate hydrolase
MSAKELERRKFLATGLALGSFALTTTNTFAASASASASIPSAASNGPGRLTMHAIDIWSGLPASAMRVDLSVLEDGGYRPVRSFETNKGGRTDQPIFEGETFKRGSYELMLHVEQHYARIGAQMPRPAFLTDVPIRFSIAEPGQRYHLAILLTPWSYSYYRGS